MEFLIHLLSTLLFLGFSLAVIQEYCLMDEDEIQTDKVPTSDILVTSQTLSFSDRKIQRRKLKKKAKKEKCIKKV